MSVAVLERPTLVLNRSWQPVHVATVARSLTMLWNESAQVVDPDDFRLYNWADWARLAPRGRAVHPDGDVSAARARGPDAAPARPPPAQCRDVLPP